MRFPRSLIFAGLASLMIGCSAPKGFRTYEQLTDKEKETSVLLKTEMFNFLTKGYNFLIENDIIGAEAMADSAAARVNKIAEIAGFPIEFCPPELSEFKGDLSYFCGNFDEAEKQYVDALELYMKANDYSPDNGVSRIIKKMSDLSFFDQR